MKMGKLWLWHFLQFVIYPAEQGEPPKQGEGLSGADKGARFLVGLVTHQLQRTSV